MRMHEESKMTNMNCKMATREKCTFKNGINQEEKQATCFSHLAQRHLIEVGKMQVLHANWSEKITQG